MSSIKNLFSKKTQKVLSGESLTGITSKGVESPDFIRSTEKEKGKFEPFVDFSSTKNFARYGSAEKYYDDSVGYIINQYPYDGSLKEKANWYNSSSYFDTYVFENEYPRTTGYVILGQSSGTITQEGGSWDSSLNPEYISFRGGPHTASSGMIGEPLSVTFTGSNYYDTSKNRESNLEINGDNGVTLEFWLNKETFDESIESRRQVIFDVWNSSSVTSFPLDPNYGRFRVGISGSGTTLDPIFYVELLSGSDGFCADTFPPGPHVTPTIAMSASSLTGSWNHFALSFINTDTQMIGKLYQNGAEVYSTSSGTPMGKITGSMLGRIGALETGVMDFAGSGFGDSDYGKLSASVDEVRFWKYKRTETDIGRYWFSQVGAGTNSDTANTKLGVYYKFNEGIVSTDEIVSLDTKVLDYSGRITNGSWIGYVTGSRSTGSAMVESSASLAEFKDPILYTSNPLVDEFISEKRQLGLDYDFRNNSGIYSSLPEWMTNDEAELNSGNIKSLVQIIGSYFDSLYLQIEAVPKLKDNQYSSGSQKPIPFTNRFLESVGLYAPEIFADANELEYYASRDDYRKFSEKIGDIKNKLYENIYNNITYIFKSKGTEKSFRNLIRCYGIDEPLVKINLYADNLSYQLRDNARSVVARKKFIDFNNTDRFDSTVYQQTASLNLNTRNFITASSDMAFVPNTMETEVIFPRKIGIASPLYFNTDFLTCSLFGCHTPLNNEADLTWNTPDVSNFQVQAIRQELESGDAYFQLTSSAGGIIPTLTSSVFKEVYDNTKWNFAVRVSPIGVHAPAPTGSDSLDCIVEFIGYNSILDNVENNFYLSASISVADANTFLSSSKRIYIGAEILNFTGTIQQKSDAKISSVRYWISDLPNETIEAHSKDASSFGTLNPHQSAYLTKNTSPYFEAVEVPQIKTLALNWSFDNVTGSGDSSGAFVSDATFLVEDMSSGSLATTSSYGWLGPVVNMQHTGKGDFFLAFDTGSVSREYVYTAKLSPPEVLNSSNMVEVRTQDDDLFTRETRPIDYFYAIEKSQAAIVSEEMIKWFSTIKDFNFLIGDPVNRYRQNYKPMEKLRERYFATIGNTINFEKFVEYFKWIDDALSVMLSQLVPASANFAEKVRLLVESHILERNKYCSKFPTLEMKIDDPEAGVYGITEMLYPWKFGRAPGEGNIVAYNPSGPGTFTEEDYVEERILLHGTASAGGYWTSQLAAVGIPPITGTIQFDERYGPGTLCKSGSNHGNDCGVYSDAPGIGVTIPGYAMFEFGKVDVLSAQDAYYGLNDNPTTPVNASDFNYAVRWGQRRIIVKENGITKFTDDSRIGDNSEPTPRLRIVAVGDQIVYQRKWNLTTGSALSDWETYYTSLVPATPGTTYYPNVDIVQNSRCIAEMYWTNLTEMPVKRNCYWWQHRAERNISSITSGDTSINNQRDIYRDADDFRTAAIGPTISTIGGVQYEGSTYALRNFTQPYRFTLESMPEIHGGSNVARIKNVEYPHAELPFGSTTQLKVIASEIEDPLDCNDIIDPNEKTKLHYKLTNNPQSYASGKGEIFAPFSLYSSSVNSGYITQIANLVKANTDITNYHTDVYGEDKERPMQGPFTEKYVGGREYRHVPYLTPSGSRLEAWNLDLYPSFGRSITFDGDNDHILVPSGSLLPSGAGAFGGGFSFAVWLRTDTAPGASEIICGRSNIGTYDEGWMLWWGDSQIRFWVGRGFSSGFPPFHEGCIGLPGLLSAGFPLTLFVGTYDNATNTPLLYTKANASGVNPSVDTVTTYTPTTFNASAESILFMGDGTAARSFAGNLSQVKFYTDVLTPAEVDNIFNDGCPYMNPEPQGALKNSWNMGPNDTFPIVFDYVMGKNGTMINMTEDAFVDDSSICNALTSGSATHNVLSPQAKIILKSRTANQPRSTILREPLAKRPINVRNIQMTTGSTIIGNYSHEYEILQTSDRKINNRFFVKNEGFSPELTVSPYISGVVDYTLPDFSLYGTTKNIFVERFNAPGGPEVSSRGAMDVDSEQFSVYNDLNQRNSIVRNALNQWYSEACGQFGVDTDLSGEIPTSPGTVGFRQPIWQSYNTLASYHKTNRNGASQGFYKSDYSREVEWTKLVNVSLTDYNRTLTNPTVPLPFWSNYAESTQILETTGYLEFEHTDPARYAVGISSNEHKIVDPPGPLTEIFWDYTFFHLFGAVFRIYEGSNFVFTTPAIIQIGDKLRIFRNKSSIFYQHQPAGKSTWTTLYSSTSTPSGNYYPRAAFRNAFGEITNVRISNPRYDNWFINHAIPQDRLQYSWINASYDKNVDQPFGFLGSGDGGRTTFSVPSGSTNSVAAPEVQFVSASDFGSYDFGGSFAWGKTAQNGDIVPTDFANINFNVYEPITSSENNLGYPLGVPLTDIVSNVQYRNVHAVPIAVGTFLAETFNALTLHRNGPYGYPSWKQIRTGETPVARYQKNNNIISFLKEEIIFAADEFPKSYQGLMKDTLIHFVEPPVTFRNKPLHTVLSMSGATEPLPIYHTYANNLTTFANPNINNFLGSIKCSEQMYDRIKSLYINPPFDTPVKEFLKMDYNDIVYPREVNTGLKKNRQRTQYAEVANGTPHYVDNAVQTFSASLSDGINGIDRGPLYRRTFWRNDPVFRNRREGATMCFASNSVGGIVCSGNYTPCITGTLPNSQGHYDGFATSINGWGRTPIVFAQSCGFPTSATNILSGSEYDSLTFLDYPDAGELNSSNFQTIGGYLGTNPESGKGQPQRNNLSIQTAYYPTASCYYYFQQTMNTPAWFGTSSLGMKWRVAELSGKNPWFDTYEDYVQDIRGTGKSFTIIPEFRISQHMDYYADGNYKKQNDKFLTLDGAEVTCSSAGANAPFATFTKRSGFNKDFFSEYSNTDFQKYFGKFCIDHDVDKITLKCNGIKKLLPYHGFYPSHRTLQVASLFSQSIAPYIGGIAWASGTTTDDASPPSGALAVQSLLQPYYAPGILYNTIKAGIACDWAAYTGSAAIDAQTITYQNGFLSQSSNYRIPFESILDPLADVGIPQSSSNGEGRMNLLYPTYKIYAGGSSWAGVHGAGLYARSPYIDLENLSRARAISSTKYNQYRLAINNLLAEIPSFFLKDNELKTIVSKPAGDVSLVSGSTYYMNVYLEKDPNIVMIQDYWNGLRGGTNNFFYPPNDPLTPDAQYRSFNGRYFGPTVQAGTPSSVGTDNDGFGEAVTKMGDPAYAPYTPPYFYGKSISTIAYTADASDEAGGFNYKKVFEKSTVTQTNPTMEGMFEILETGAPHAPALSGAMGLSSSLSLFGLFAEKESTQDAAGNLTTVTNKSDSNRNKWVISPRMETPVLDFSTQPEQKGWGRGMWSGYGNILTSSNGITFGIEETFKGVKTGICETVSSEEISWTNLVNLTSSLSNTKLEKGTGGTSWNGGAAGPRKVDPGAYITCVADDIGPYIMFGLNGDAPASPSFQDMEFAIQTKAANVYSIWESNIEVVMSAWNYLVGDSFRILRTVNDEIKYQHSSGSNGIYTTVYTSTSSSLNSILYPDVAIGDVGVSLSGLTQYPAIDVAPLCQESLLQKCFTNPEEKQIGEIAEEKEISEAIVAIPFAVKGSRAATSAHDRALTTNALGKNFFRIDQEIFDINRESFLKRKNGIYFADPRLSESIQLMLKRMDNYIIPPELDFLTFAEGSLKVRPFVMYLFEFNHTLKAQDLADIWQGVMPDISRVAKLSDSEIDNNIFSHPTGPNEFFHGKKIPEDVRWMVFKVKKRANFDYFKMTADTTDDAKFDFKFNVGGVELPYSYNWPYDYCSLVELAQIEVGNEFITKLPKVEVAGREIITRNLTPFEKAARAGRVTTGSIG